MYNQNFDKIGLKRRWEVGFPCLSRNEWLTISDGPSYHFPYFRVILNGKLMDSIVKESFDRSHPDTSEFGHLFL